MQLNRLFRDVTAVPEGSSDRHTYATLARMLKEAGDTSITAGGIEKWAQRGSIPGSWLIRIASVANDAGRPVDMADYA